MNINKIHSRFRSWRVADARVVGGKNTNNGRHGNTVNRRLDIYDAINRRAKEFKEYFGGKVYRSDDIVNEVLRDKQLMADRVITDMEWVFKGCEPSGPLEILLKSGPNPIKIVKIP